MKYCSTTRSRFVRFECPSQTVPSLTGTQRKAFPFVSCDRYAAARFLRLYFFQAVDAQLAVFVHGLKRSLLDL